MKKNYLLLCVLFLSIVMSGCSSRKNNSAVGVSEYSIEKMKCHILDMSYEIASTMSAEESSSIDNEISSKKIFDDFVGIEFVKATRDGGILC